MRYNLDAKELGLAVIFQKPLNPAILLKTWELSVGGANACKQERMGKNTKMKTAKKLWIGVLAIAIYLVSVSTVIILDYSLHWGLLLGLIILATIHILFIVSIFFYHFGSKKT